MMKSENRETVHYVYLAGCANGSLYVGYTKNVQLRIARHNAGNGRQFTRTNRPLRLIASWPFNSRTEARRAECELKRRSPEAKLALAEVALSLQWEKL